MSQPQTRPGFVPKGAATFPIEHFGPPRDFYFLLLPKLTMLAFSSAVEPLRIANQITGRELYRWFVMTEDGDPIRCSNGILITPDLPLSKLPSGAETFVCAGTEPASSTSTAIVNWLARQKAHGGKCGGICTGAFALAKAGLIGDRTFTLHWENQPAFIELFPELRPTENLYEADRGLMTCGGGTAALDMMLGVIERDFGADMAIIVADMCIHAKSDRSGSPQKSAHAAGVSSRNPHLLSAMKLIDELEDQPIAIQEIADHAGISRRQLERLFKKYLGMSPAQYSRDVRVARAHALLNETSMSIMEIAVSTGFSGAAQLNQHFRRRYGQSPSAFRKSWGTEGTTAPNARS